MDFVDEEISAQGLSGSAELGLGKSVGDDGDGYAGVLALVLRNQQASCGGSDAEGGEEGSADELIRRVPGGQPIVPYGKP